MRKTRWTKTVALAAGVTVVTTVLAGAAAAEEAAGGSALTMPRIERPGVDPDAENPSGESRDVGSPEARTESPTLPTPAHHLEPPPPPDSALETVIGEAVVVTLAPRRLRRPRFHP